MGKRIDMIMPDNCKTLGSGTDPWRWISNVLIGILVTIMFGIGAWIIRGQEHLSEVIEARSVVLMERLAQHEKAPGHEMLTSRINLVERDIAEIKTSQAAALNKLDRLLQDKQGG